MESKIVFAVIFAFLAVQASAAPQHTEDVADDVVKFVAQWLVNATTALSTSVNDVDSAIATSEEHISQIVASVSNSVSQIVINTNDAILADLDSLSETADETGKKLIACTQAEGVKADGLINSTIAELLTCSSGDLNPALEQVRVLLKDFNTSLGKVTTSATTLENCGLGAAICGLQFVNDVKGIIEDFATAAKTDITELVKILQGIDQTVDACAKTFASEYQKNRVESFNDISKCLSA